MKPVQLIILVSFAAVLLVPFFARRSERSETGLPRADDKQAARLIVVTPHIEQIRQEFAEGFNRWHIRKYNQPVVLDYRTPGGTTEIVKLLEAMYGSAMQRRVEQILALDPAAATAKLLDPKLAFDDMTVGEVDFDLMFGGGTFDHDRLRSRGASIDVPIPSSAGARQATLLAPRERFKSDTLADLREVDVQVKLSATDAPIRLKVPVAAIEGNADALKPLSTEGTATDITVKLDLARCRRVVTVRMSRPPEPMLTPAELRAVYGEKNLIGTGQLYQDNQPSADKPFNTGKVGDTQHWLGTALSGFGIVYNRPLHTSLNLKPPTSWNDLRRPEYAGRLAMADPRLSGSVATLYDSILNTAGFDEGFRTLRDMCANARSFAAASTQPPMDVSQGDALAGVAIDFYGRFQAQSVLNPGETTDTGRLGYIDPPGAVYVDADPVSVLRGGPNPTIARRFVEYCLSEEAQALWQFPALRDGDAAKNSPVIDGDPTGRKMGPDQFVLLRMPIRRSMYEPGKFDHFAVKVNLFDLASTVPTRGWRDGMIVMMGAFGIDNADSMQEAWRAIRTAEANATFPRTTLDEMKKAFYAMPKHRMSDGSELEFTEPNYSKIAADCARWRDPKRGPIARIAYTKFFRAQYEEVLRLYRSASRKG
ncbi:MAG: extracellular solute-binding protein [Phycisphaerales bacterium]|nr:extracellular solute-binding protein [Phycisphaerales bacterium]